VESKVPILKLMNFLSEKCLKLKCIHIFVCCYLHSHIDHHLMHYSLVVSTSKIYSTLCEAESRLEEKQKWNVASNNSENELLLNDRLEVNLIIIYQINHF